MITLNSPPTSSRHEVPQIFYESHIETGYRSPNQPWGYYVTSLFQKHNECMNIWTHLVGFIWTLNKIWNMSREFSLLGDSNMWPLTAGLLTMAIMFLCSTMAHCIQNKSELIHYTGFMIDYAGIGIYGHGTILLHFTYSIDKSLLDHWVRHFAIPVGTFLGILTCICGSIAKVMYRKPYPAHQMIWQYLSVGAIYIWGAIPLFHRIALSLEHGEWDESLQAHTEQIVWFALAGLFFGSDIPQRFFPGKFDFLGHSHQIFHVCIVIVTLKQMDGVYLDIRRLQFQFAGLEMPTFMESIGSVILVTVGNSIVVFLFYGIAKCNIQQTEECQKTQAKCD